MHVQITIQLQFIVCKASKLFLCSATPLYIQYGTYACKEAVQKLFPLSPLYIYKLHIDPQLPILSQNLGSFQVNEEVIPDWHFPFFLKVPIAINMSFDRDQYRANTTLETASKLIDLKGIMLHCSFFFEYAILSDDFFLVLPLSSL